MHKLKWKYIEKSWDSKHHKGKAFQCGYQICGRSCELNQREAENLYLELEEWLNKKGAKA